jgi:2-succinyl-6-hydroxy-2,4-cyclohexadiene-1-carboxylate synthase
VPRIAVNSIHLNVEQIGSGPPLVLLHGFTGNAANWAPHLDAFSEHFTVYAIDIIGHGESDAPVDLTHYRMERAVDDLSALLDRLDLTSIALLGYSMGGRVALHLALAVPERVGALALESASPGIADPDERAARVRADEALAASIERDGLAAFIDRWQRLPLFASQQRLPREVQQRQRTVRLANRPTGLANSLRGMGAGAMTPVWDRLETFAAPTLLLAGALDAKYVGQGTAMAQLMPRATRLVLPDVGHTTHLEAPELFDRTVLDWLTRTFTGGRNGRADPA